LSRDSFKDISHRFIRSEKFDCTIEDINRLGRFSWWHKGLIYFLSIYYYPLGVYARTKLRERKAVRLSKLVKKIQKVRSRYHLGYTRLGGSYHQGQC
jgi:hypothetical protein